MYKTSGLQYLNDVAQDDLVHIVDVSDTETMGSSTGTNKRININDLALGFAASGSLEAPISVAPSPSTNYYYRGDKEWATLNSTAVGLGNVDNLSRSQLFASPTFTGTVTLPAGTITNDVINDSAAIALSKLATGALPTAITVSSANIVDGTIVDSDISNTASISQSKIANLTGDLAAKANLNSPSFIGTPTAVTAAPNTSTTQLATTEFVTNAISSTSQFRNRVINGNFDIWQRGTSITNSVTGGVPSAADRWIALSYIPPTNSPSGIYTLSRRETTATEFSLFNANYYHRTTNAITSIGTTPLNTLASATTANSTAYGGIATQNIEQAAPLLGKTVTVSFWSRASQNTKVFLTSIVYETGGFWTPMICKTFDLTTSWQKYTHTFVMPTYAQVVAAAYSSSAVNTSLTNPAYTPITPPHVNNWLHQIAIRNMWSLGTWRLAGNAYSGARPSGFEGTQQTLAEMQAINDSFITNGWYDIAQIQVEEGAVATSFEHRPIGTELALCQRYYEVVNVAMTRYNNSGHWGGALTNIPFAVQKRTTNYSLVKISLGASSGGVYTTNIDINDTAKWPRSFGANALLLYNGTGLANPGDYLQGVVAIDAEIY